MAMIRRVRAVERELFGGRRLVHALDADQAIQLSGSAPVVWDLLGTIDDERRLLHELTEVYDDSPAAIAEGMEAALRLLTDVGLIERTVRQ